MKRSILVLTLLVVGFLVCLFIGKGNKPVPDDTPNVARHSQSSQHVATDATASDDQRSATRVIGGVTEKGQLIPENPVVATQPEEDDGFVKKIIAEKWIDANEDKAGRRRVRIVQADFKYPHIRLEEEVWTDPQTGKQTVNRLLASVADHVMVGLKQGADEQAARKMLEQNGYRIRAVEPDSYILAELADFKNIDDQQKSIADIEALEEFIDYAEPDYLVYPSVVPNDPAFSSRKMWGLDNPGTVAGTTADADIDAPEAWEIRSDASNVIVAVTDTGIQYNHEDLAPNMWSKAGTGEHGLDAYDNDNDPMDTGGHGTHCAGTIGARGNNNIGLTGVAWNVQLMAGRFLGPQGGSTSDGIRVVNYARINGADIISASWGGGGFSKGLYDAIKAAGDAGIPFIAAAGNSSTNNDSTPHYPSSYDLPTLVAVASTTSKDTLSYFSCYGRYSVDIGAPGSDIWSSYIGSNSSYKHLNGTSMATPHVSGAMALARAHFPDDGAEDLIARLYSSVDPIPALSGKVTTGGRLNLQKLLGVSISDIQNDDFENAFRFEGEYGHWSGSNKKASREADEDSFSIPNIGNRSVWFAWKAPYKGLVSFTVEASAPPMHVIAFRGGQKDNLRMISDGYGISQKNTKTITFYCSQDQEYRFLIDSFHATGQNLLTTLRLMPENDAYGSALELSGDRFSTLGSNRNATDEDFERQSPHGGVGKGKSVWWKWTPDFDGEFVITTQGSEFDTVLAVYTGTQYSLNEEVFNDDRNALDWTSQVTFNAVSGTEYYIAVDGYRGDAAGGILLNGGRRGELFILKQPADAMVLLGDDVDFSVVGMSYGEINYAWYKNGQLIEGVRGETLHINSVTGADFTKYHVVLSDGDSSIRSRDAELSELRLPPKIEWSPRAISIASGQNLTLDPRVSGSETLAYQWYKDGVAVVGEDSKILSIINIDTSHQGFYQLEVSNDLGTAKSKLINVSVLNIPWASWAYTYPYPQGYDIYDIKFADGLYVAVGDAGAIVSSPNAETWKVHSLGETDYRFRRVVHGNGIWLAADWSGHLAWSSDMVVWNTNTQSNFATGNSIFDLFYWNSQFYFIVRDGSDTKIYTSSNASAWTLREVFTGKFYNDALTSPSTMVLCEIGTNDVLSTTNGTTWTRTTVVPGDREPPLNRGVGLYKDGEFKLWAKSYQKGIWSSSNGVDWVFTDQGSQNYWPSLDQYYDNSMAHTFVFANGMYYWVDEGWKFFHVSVDGLTWKRYSVGFEVNTVTEGPGSVVIAGDDGVTSKAAEVSGLYGRSLLSPINPNEYFVKLKVVNKRAWALTSGGRYFSSSDGSSWHQDGDVRELGSLTYANGEYWCGGQGLSIGGTVYKIFRGNHPTDLKEVKECNLTSISLLAHNGNKFVAVSTAAPRGIYHSVDGVVWSVAYTSNVTGTTFRVLECVGDLFIGLDGDGNIYSSSDGENWNKYQTGAGYSARPEKTAYSKGLYFALGGEGDLWYSSDAVSWNHQDLGRYTNTWNLDVGIVGDEEGVAVFLNKTGLYSKTPADHNSWFQFNLPTPSFMDSAYFAGSVIATGGYGSLSLLQGGTPISFAPVGKFKNVLDGGRYLVNSQIKIQTEAFDPEGGTVITSFWIDGVKIADSTQNNPGFDWYPTVAGEHSLRIDVIDSTGVKTEHRIVLEILESSIIGNHARLNNSTALIKQGGALFLGGENGRFSLYQGDGQYRDIALPTEAEITSSINAKGVSVVGGDEVFISSDGYNWNLIPELSGRAGYDNGLFYVVGNQELHISDNGYHWESISDNRMSLTSSLVFYQNGRIIVGGNRSLLVSDNRGKSWKDLEVDNRSMIRWRGKLLVASLGELYETEDAITWTNSTLPNVGGYLGSILKEAGGMLFLARPANSSAGGFELMYVSSDASEWTPAARAVYYHDIAYGNNKWVSFGAAAAYQSKDGVNWELFLGDDSGQPIPVDTPFEYKQLGATKWNVEYHEELGFVALGNTSYDIIYATSLYGETWSLEKGISTNNNYWTQIATNDGYSCIYQGGQLKGSDNFGDWEVVENQPTSGSVGSIKILNNSFVCLTSSGQVGFSANGRDWRYFLVEQGASLRDVEFLNGKYVIVAAGGLYHAVDRVYVSTDEETWTKVNLPGEYPRITVDDTQFIVQGHRFTWFATSSDGLTWTETKLVSNEIGVQNIKTVTSGAGGYLITDSSKGTFTTDFITWTPVVFGNAGSIMDVLYSATSGFTVLTSQAGIFNSADGKAWSAPMRAISGAQFLMEDGESFYIASGAAVELQTSSDLEVVSIHLVSGEYGVGDVIQADVVVKNHSSEPIAVGEATFEFVASKDPLLGNSEDFLISKGHTLLQPIPANSTVTETIELVIPADMPAGSAFVGVYAALPQGAVESNMSNNIQMTANAVITIPEWELNLVTDGNGQVNQDFAALRYPHKARVSLTANAGKGAAFAGWGGDALGAENQITILMDGNKSVQANFSSRASLQVLVRGAGEVTGLADLGSYAVNDTALLTAVAVDGWAFSGWSGAATGNTTTANITMGANKVLTATFVKPKATWKSEHFTTADYTEAELNDPLITGDDADPDGDGLKNWQEYLHLSDPRDKDSRGVVDLKVDGGFLYAIFTRNSGVEDGHSLACEGSRDMSDWDAPDIQERVLSTTDGVETVEARIPADGNQKGFLRLKYQK